MFVYVIVNDVNLKIYVGKTTRSNLQQYLQQKFYEAGKRLGGNSHLYAAIRKYGREHFHIYPLFEGTTNEEICVHEKVSEESKRKVGAYISANRTGSNNPSFGKRQSEETIAKRRATMAQRRFTKAGLHTLQK